MTSRNESSIRVNLSVRLLFTRARALRVINIGMLCLVARFFHSIQAIKSDISGYHEEPFGRWGARLNRARIVPIVLITSINEQRVVARRVCARFD
jgi:hypothetical protein